MDSDDEESELRRLRQSHMSGRLEAANRAAALFGGGRDDARTHRDIDRQIVGDVDVKESSSVSTVAATTSTSSKEWRATVITSDISADDVRAMLPMGFGKQHTEEQKRIESKDKVFEGTRRNEEIIPQGTFGPSPYSASVSNNRGKINNEENDDISRKELEKEDSVDDDYGIPISHEVTLKGHNKTVSALALNKPGARLITGSYDFEINLYDFGGMDRSMRPFRNIEAFGSHQLNALSWSPNSEHFAASAGSSRAQVVTKDGNSFYETQKGDPYIQDRRKTKGHVSMINAVHWHPSENELFATCSSDSTVRVWSIEDKSKHRQVFKCHAMRGQVAGRPAPAVNWVRYSSDAKYICAAVYDGSLQLFSTRGSGSGKPAMAVADAHVSQTEISSLCFSNDGHRLVSRGMDDTVKLWDMRMFKKSVASAENLTSFYAQTAAIFSPNGELIVTGTSVKKNEGSGCLVFLDSSTLELRRRVGISPSSVVGLAWHPTINQIVAGCGNGDVKVFYNPKTSVKGAKMALVKAPRKVDPSDFAVMAPVFTPHALPLFQDDMLSQTQSLKRKREKDRRDPVKSHKPSLPIGGDVRGVGGNVGSSWSHSIVRSTVKDDVGQEQNIQQRLLRHGDLKSKGSYMARAYGKTQPTTILATKTAEQEEEERAANNK